MCGKYFKKKHRIAKHTQKKHKHILIPKVPKNFMAFNNHAQRSTPPYYLDVDNPLYKLYKTNAIESHLEKKNIKPKTEKVKSLVLQKKLY